MIRIPTKCGKKDKSGYYCQWGNQKKYYYKKGDKVSMARARAKANSQGAAAHASGYKGANDISKQGGKVQSLVFKKPKFDASKSKLWAKSHGFKSGNVRETENTVRLQQFPPNLCIRSGGTIKIAPGITGYVCPTKINVKADLISELSDRLYDLEKCLIKLRNKLLE